MNSSTPAQGRTIVVGADGSAGAERALRWAALEAVKTGASLHLVTVWTMPVLSWSVGVDSSHLDPVEIAAQAARTIERAHHSVEAAIGTCAVAVETSVLRGGAAEVLLRVAADASMLVLGTRGRGGFAALVLGSVTATCAHHTPVPLAVIGPEAPAPGSGDLVVGIDDSPGGRTALRWAVAEAKRTGAAIRAVHGWQIPITPPGVPSVGPLGDPYFAGPTREELERLVAEEGGVEVDRPKITLVTLSMSAPELLIAEGKSAALLVVGARGRGGFLGLLLGSVSQHCLHHSPCPLVIVPSES